MTTAPFWTPASWPLWLLWILRRNRKAIKEGMIRQSLGNPLDKSASDLDLEVAIELARQWDEEDVTCPPQRRTDEDDDDQ